MHRKGKKGRPKPDFVKEKQIGHSINLISVAKFTEASTKEKKAPR